MEWININDRMPENGQNVMFKNHEGKYIGFFDATRAAGDDEKCLGTFYEGTNRKGALSPVRGIGFNVWKVNGEINHEIKFWCPIEFPE